MYKISWDKHTGGVRLHSDVTPDTLGISPRPVFWEELDILKLNECGWTYPHCEEPLLWACNKQYFYRGELVFEAKGANLYDPATIVFNKNINKGLKLKPVDVSEMLRRNKDYIFLLESEAIEFIRDTYLQYSSANRSTERVAANQLDYNTLLERAEKKTKKKMAIVKEDCDSFDIVPLDTAKKTGKRIYQTTKIDRFLASFSGGKDSQVVLDLCTRAIPSTDFEVIYSDTGYELPPSLQLYAEIKKCYTGLYPDLRFSIARNHESVLNYWDKIGTPSDTHRWCCSVMKTAPLYKMLKIEGTNKQAKVLTFDGVRAEESVRRESYQRIGKGKHTNVVNAHPIIGWNTVEIFLYLFQYHLPINKGYRFGKARVGCLVCPFTSSWDDMINNKVFEHEMKPFIDRIVSYSKYFGISESMTFLKERKWKIKSLGNQSTMNTNVSFSESNGNFKADIYNPNLKITQWLAALCDFTVVDDTNGFKGELRYNNSIYSYEIKQHLDNKISFYVYGIKDNSFLLLLKRVIYKSAYCVQCEVCEVDCPTGALSIYPNVHIDTSKCIHCHKCINIHDRGCIAADCLRMINNTDKKMNTKLQGYKTFGLREDWINEYFLNPEEFWGDNTLGTAQVDSIKAWLRDAEITDSKHQITKAGKLMKDIYDFNPQMFWEIAYINLTYNSCIVGWYAQNIGVNQPYDKKILINSFAEQGYTGSMATLKNAVSALVDLLKKSPLGNTLVQGVEIGNGEMCRNYYEDISEEAIAYSIYKYAHKQGITSYRVSDLYKPESEHGVFKEFCIPKIDFEKILRQLSVNSTQILNAELNMGLDHITVRDEYDEYGALKALLGL